MDNFTRQRYISIISHARGDDRALIVLAYLTPWNRGPIHRGVRGPLWDPGGPEALGPPGLHPASALK